MQAVKIIILATIVTCLYGILHDQVTIRVCPAYFTIGHPTVFGLESFTLIALAWGIIATWWCGAILGVVLALVARVGKWPKLSVGYFIKPLGIITLIMVTIATASGFAGYYFASQGYVWLAEPLASGVPENQYVYFLADL